MDGGYGRAISVSSQSYRTSLTTDVARESDAMATLKRYELSGVKEIGRELGRGTCGVVVEVEYKGVRYAGKHLHMGVVHLTRFNANQSLMEDFLEEIILHSQLDHPNIVQFVGVYYKLTSTVTLPVLVMELLPTTLEDYLIQHGVPPNETTYSILRDVALGLQYLHEHRPIIHCDLNANNILLTGDLHAKVFGVTKHTALAFQTLTYPRSGTETNIFAYGVLILRVCSVRWPSPSNRFGLDLANPQIEDIIKHRQRYYLDQMGADHPLRSLTIDCLSNVPQPTVAQILYRLQEVISGEW